MGPGGNGIQEWFIHCVEPSAHLFVWFLLAIPTSPNTVNVLSLVSL